MFKTRVLAKVSVVALLPFFIITLFALDIFADIQNRTTSMHVMLDIGLAGAVLMFVLLLKLKRKARLETSGTTAVLPEKATASVEEQNGTTVRFGDHLEKEFINWRLTPAEREVALLVLKGFSLKEIGEVRKVSERTVRHQALAVYEKAGVESRAQLSAYFIEDLLAL